MTFAAAVYFGGRAQQVQLSVHLPSSVHGSKPPDPLLTDTSRRIGKSAPFRVVPYPLAAIVFALNLVAFLSKMWPDSFGGTPGFMENLYLHIYPVVGPQSQQASRFRRFLKKYVSSRSGCINRADLTTSR